MRDPHLGGARVSGHQVQIARFVDEGRHVDGGGNQRPAHGFERGHYAHQAGRPRRVADHGLEPGDGDRHRAPAEHLADGERLGAVVLFGPGAVRDEQVDVGGRDARAPLSLPHRRHDPVLARGRGVVGVAAHSHARHHAER